MVTRSETIKHSGPYIRRYASSLFSFCSNVFFFQNTTNILIFHRTSTLSVTFTDKLRCLQSLPGVVQSDVALYSQESQNIKDLHLWKHCPFWKHQGKKIQSYLAVAKKTVMRGASMKYSILCHLYCTLPLTCISLGPILNTVHVTHLIHARKFPVLHASCVEIPRADFTDAGELRETRADFA